MTTNIVRACEVVPGGSSIVLDEGEEVIGHGWVPDTTKFYVLIAPRDRMLETPV